MFCRSCHYDLRGLDTPRCPECRRTFAPGDPGTFLAELPTLCSRLRGAGRSVLKRRVLLISLASVAWAIMVLTLLPSFPRQQTAGLPKANLRSVMTEWMILQNEKPSQTSFDKSAAIRDLRPSISPWTEYSILDSRSYLCFIILLIKVLAMPTFICAGLVALLWRGLARKIALAITILCLVFILPSYYSQSLSEFFFPGSYAFLDDYVYIDGIDFKAVDRNTRIAAYDWRTFTQVGYKTIAFADGHIEWLDEAQARALFDAQGIPYPEPAPEGKRE